MSDSAHKKVAWEGFVNRDPAPNHRECFDAGWVSGKGFLRIDNKRLRALLLACAPEIEARVQGFKAAYPGPEINAALATNEDLLRQILQINQGNNT